MRQEHVCLCFPDTPVLGSTDNLTQKEESFTKQLPLPDSLLSLSRLSLSMCVFLDDVYPWESPSGLLGAGVRTVSKHKRGWVTILKGTKRSLTYMTAPDR